MSSLTYLTLLGLLGSAISSPMPQGMELGVLQALPSPSTYTVAIGVAAQTVSIDQASIIASVVSVLTENPTATTLGLQKRTPIATSVCHNGKSQPTGAGPVPSPDSVSAFLAYPAFSSAATSAPTPADYALAFQNLRASNNAYNYMGFTTLSAYDSNACAIKCNHIGGCEAFNLYFERDPSVDPGSGSNCENPPSTTNIKCVFWGVPLDSQTAVNSGQWRDQFQVVIAGSNAYNKIPDTPAGYTTPLSLGNYAINAPLQCNGADTYMGVKIFQNTAFNVSLCAQACSATSAYDVAHGLPSADAPQTCQFFNTYMLYKNYQPIAQYCALYNETWNKTWATNNGQYDGAGNHYTIANSYISSNATNPGICTPAPTCTPALFDLPGPSIATCSYSSDGDSYGGGDVSSTFPTCPGICYDISFDWNLQNTYALFFIDNNPPTSFNQGDGSPTIGTFSQPCAVAGDGNDHSFRFMAGCPGYGGYGGVGPNPGGNAITITNFQITPRVQKE